MAASMTHSILAVAAIVAGGWLPTSAYADPPPLEELQQAFFHVSVAGTAADPAAAGNREGKAFAIGPNLLITSRHIVGASADWKAKPGLPMEIARATAAIDRTLALMPGGEDIPENLGENALVSSGSALDIAEVSVPDGRLDHFFGLSMCDIRQGEDYLTLVASRSAPTDPASVRKPMIVQLRAAGYDVQNYGDLFVFDLEDDYPMIEWEPDGHEGSPIFDLDGNVVGIVSAVTLTPANGYRILATPIRSPLSSAIGVLNPPPPGAKPKAIKCSLADAVRRINEQVGAYASWRLDGPRLSDGTPEGDLTLSYESVADYPNIESVTVDYEFLGKIRINDPNITTKRLQYSDDEPVNTVTLRVRGSEKSFDGSGIVDEARTQLEPYLLEKKAGGYIEYIKLTIVGMTLQDGREITKEHVLTFDWKVP
jgi:hypothetical protein